MKNFVLKGNVLYSKSKDEIASFENAYVVCSGGVCKGVFDVVPSEFEHFEIVDLGDKLIIPRTLRFAHSCVAICFPRTWHGP